MGSFHISEGGIRILHEARGAGAGKDSKGAGGLTSGIRKCGCGFLKFKIGFGFLPIISIGMEWVENDYVV